jgi:uncharacterized protein YndB with AHSA1/START domain
MINSEEKVEIRRPPDEVFRFLDDEANAPRWNERCVELKRVSPGEKAVGTKLCYVYKEPGRQGEMDGEVVAYDKGRKLAMRFTDPTMAVHVAFELTPSAQGTEVLHSVGVEPRSFVTKLLAPLIRRGVKKQTAMEAQSLKRTLEAG